MKLLLVQAYSRFLSQAYPPVGLSIIGAIARKCGWTVDIIDAQISKTGPAYVLRHIQKKEGSGREPYAAVGISGTIPTAPYIESLSRILRQQQPELQQFLGGPYVSSLRWESLVRTRADVSVPGEAEHIFPKILKSLENSTGYDHIPGLYSRNSILKMNSFEAECKVTGKLHNSEVSKEIVSWSDIPLPHWDRTQIKEYWRTGNLPISCRTSKYMILFTSRGCPFDCSYCHHHFGRLFRPRPVESTLEEIGQLKKNYGIHEIHIHDDAFNVNEEHALSILDAIQKQHPDIFLSFPNGFRLDRLSDDLLRMLKICGVKQINIGIETGVDRIRERTLKWNLSNSDIMKNCRRIKRFGFRLHSQFMLGFPGETEKEMNRTIKFACTLPLDTVNFSAVCPYPGTRLYREVIDSGRTMTEDYGQYLFHSRRFVNVSDVTDSEFKRIRTRAVRDFYFRPNIVYNALRDPVTWTSIRGRTRWLADRFLPV